MLDVIEYGKPKVRGRRGFQSSGEKKGSRKWVELADGSQIRWWGGVWKFQKARFNTKVATSLNTRAMSIAVDNGREVLDIEKFHTFEAFMKRIVPIVGAYEFLRIVEWFKA